MINFRKLFNKKPTTGNKEREDTFPPNLLISTEDRETKIKEIDEQFFSLLLGVHSQLDVDLNSFEKSSIIRLNNLIKNKTELQKKMPRLPLILPKIMSVLKADNSTALDVANIIEEDPVLVADVIRLTNSPIYKTKEKITSLEQATVIIGRAGLQRLVTCALLKPILSAKGGHFTQLSSGLTWELSEKVSIAVFNLCEDDDENKFHAYLAGLLQNLGLTIGLKVLDSEFDASEAPHSRQFLKVFDNLCQIISLEIAKSWSMSDRIVNAFSAIVNTDTSKTSSDLHVNLYIANTLAKAQIISDKINLTPFNSEIMLNNKTCQKCIDSLIAINYKIS
ncbi:MAG: HDOD domain-containing protein [Gammaproteobacteria bacterium]|nr:HDOD domain-containing protein [Gammaproteobacteria bacterium]